jgi:hypothetical protein
VEPGAEHAARAFGGEVGRAHAMGGQASPHEWALMLRAVVHHRIPERGKLGGFRGNQRGHLDHAEGEF